MPYVHVITDTGAEIHAQIEAGTGGTGAPIIAAVDVTTPEGHHVNRVGQLSEGERAAIERAAGAALEARTEAGETPKVTTKRAAEILDVSRSTVGAWARAGHLPCRRDAHRGSKSRLFARPLVRRMARHRAQGGSAKDFQPGRRHA